MTESKPSPQQMNGIVALIERLKSEDLTVADVLVDVSYRGEGGLLSTQPSTLVNVDAVFRRHGVIPRYNMMSKQSEITFPHGDLYSPRTVQERNSVMSDLLLKYRLKDKPALFQHMEALSLSNPYHPVEDWILSEEPEYLVGSPNSCFQQFLKLFTYQTPADAGMAVTYWYRWFIQAIEAARGWRKPQPTSKPGVLVLVGPQGIGKSRIIGSLAPQPYVYVGGTLALDGYAARDSMHSAAQYWIVELGELDSTFTRSAQNALKNYLSKSVDTYRRAYAQFEDSFVRCHVFAATVNVVGFQMDPTGNRRYWPIHVKSIDVPESFPWQQLWAEMNYFYESGEQWWLTPEEESLRVGREEAFTASDELEDALDTLFPNLDTAEPDSSWTPQTFTDICHLAGIPTTRTNATKMEHWFHAQGVKRRAKVQGVRKCWVLPVVDTERNLNRHIRKARG